MQSSCVLTTVYLFLCLSVAVPAHASDAVVFWNEVATNAVGPSNHGPAGILDLAKVHLAVHDAVQALDHEFEPYCGDIANAAGSREAAVARAARDVLVSIFPAQMAGISTTYQTYLNDHGLNNDPGLAVGAQAATCLLTMRANDGSFPNPSPTFFGGEGPGEWRSTTNPATSMVVPWLGMVTPFALKSPSRLRPSPPRPDLTSGQYTHAYNEVRDLGAKNSALRTPEQTDLSHFFSDNFLALWQRSWRDEQLAATLGLKLPTVKKRWAAVFQHVAVVRPDLVPNNDRRDVADTCGPQKRHVLLEYLRRHAEELKPGVGGHRRLTTSRSSRPLRLN